MCKCSFINFSSTTLINVSSAILAFLHTKVLKKGFKLCCCLYKNGNNRLVCEDDLHQVHDDAAVHRVILNLAEDFNKATPSTKNWMQEEETLEDIRKKKNVVILKAH